MHTHKLGDTLYFHAVTTDDTGAAVAPTSITTTLYRNGTAVGALTAVAMTSMATGLYTASAAITAGNGFADGDRIAVFATAVMSGVSKVALLCEYEITSYSIDGVNVAAMAANSMTASAAASDFVVEITNQVWEEAAANHAGSPTNTVFKVLEDAASRIESILADTGTDGVVVASGSKTGYALSSTGLDSIATTAPTGVASNFREMIVQTWRRFFKKAVHDTAAETLKTYADDGTTLITTQTLGVSGDTETQGAAS